VLGAAQVVAVIDLSGNGSEQVGGGGEVFFQAGEVVVPLEVSQRVQGFGVQNIRGRLVWRERGGGT
jgi:hypothetical protein